MVYYPKGYALTRKQKDFADEYLANGFDGYKAALKAGYSNNRAVAYEAKLLTQPQIHNYIQLYIAEAMAKQKDKQHASIEKFERNMRKLDYIIDNTICEAEAIEVNSASLGIKAMDMQAKLFGHYAPVKQANLNVNVNKDDIDSAKSLLTKLISDNTKDY